MELTRRSLLASVAVPFAGSHEVAVPSSPPDGPATVRIDGNRRLGFVGDVMLGRGVDERWRDRDPLGIWTDLREHLASLDGLFLNLECCLSKRGERRPGRTFYFRADPDWAVPALNAAGATWANLANNHLLDYGPVALADTRAALSSGDILYAGAGPDLDSALSPSVVEVRGVRLAVLAFTDQAPLYSAGPNSPGTAFTSLNHQRTRTRRLVGDALEAALGADPDLVVASLHWGPNWEVRPSGAQRAFARWLVDHGVDVVHGHSAHVIQGVEVYRGRPIIYDAGDFVDDYAVKEALHNDWSFLFELEIADGVLRVLRLVPVEIENSAVGRAGDEAAAWLRDRMRTLSEPFGTTVEDAGAGVRIPLWTA